MKSLLLLRVFFWPENQAMLVPNATSLSLRYAVYVVICSTVICRDDREVLAVYFVFEFNEDSLSAFCLQCYDSVGWVAGRASGL